MAELWAGKEEEGEEEEDESRFLEAYTGVMRVTVNVKGDLTRAVRLVVDPKTDTWEEFTAELLKKLRISSDAYFLERARTRKEVKAIADLKPNDVLSITPIIVTMKELEALNDSPLCLARTRHFKLRHLGPTDRFGPSFVGTCSKKGLPDAAALYALKLELDVNHIKPHPFVNEYQILAGLKPADHRGVIRIWSSFTEDALTKKVIKLLPDFVHTLFADAKALNAKWIPRAQFTVVDHHADNLADLRPVFDTPMPWNGFIGWAADLGAALFHLHRNKTVHLNLSLANCLVANDGRIVLSNFALAKRFKSKSMVLSYTVGVIPGGDQGMLAPEVVCMYNRCVAAGAGSVPYRGQAVWALGMLLFQIITGEYAWPGYPYDYTNDDGIITYDTMSLLPWLPPHYPLEFRELLLSMLNHDPDARPTMRQVNAKLEKLLGESWGEARPPEARWNLDDSSTGTWVRMWTHEGGMGQVPLEPSHSLLHLRDAAAVRVCLGCWWEAYGLRYAGRVWNLVLDRVEDMDLREDSRVYVLLQDMPPLPRGPTVLFTWTWEGMEPIFAMRKLGALLEDHASPMDRVLEGIDYMLQQVALPEELWELSPQVPTPEMVELVTLQTLPTLWKNGGASLCPSVVTQFVASYAKHPVVAAKAAELLHWLGVHRHVREKMRRTHGAHMIIVSMVAHRFYGPMQHHGAWALGNFALDADNREFICELGGLLALVEGLDPHLEDAGVQRYCMQAIAMLCTENPGAKVDARKLSATETVIRGLQFHYMNPRVLDAGFQALMRIAEDDEVNREALGGVGTIDMAVKALDTHPKDAGLAAAATMFILAMSLDHEDNKRKAGAVGALARLLTATKHHLNDAVVMRYVVNCIKCLCQYDEDNFNEARDLDAIEDLILVRASHEDLLVVKAVNRALKLLHGHPALYVE